MPQTESGVQFYSTEHLHVFKPRLITCKEDLREALLEVLSQLGWYHHELIPMDTQHPPGLGISAQLERVALTARANPQSMSLAFAAINFDQAPDWGKLPDILKFNFPARTYRDLSS